MKTVYDIAIAAAQEAKALVISEVRDNALWVVNDHLQSAWFRTPALFLRFEFGSFLPWQSALPDRRSQGMVACILMPDLAATGEERRPATSYLNYVLIFFPISLPRQTLSNCWLLANRRGQRSKRFMFNKPSQTP